MSTNMRVRKGDLVHILSGKDRGKQGRVIDARPKERKVIVETRPLSKTKNWRLAQVLEVAK
jgi:ribosomal protein L24